MASVHRQDPSTQHDHRQDHQHANNQSFNQYTNIASNDDFNTFFNVPGDDAPNQNFTHTWESNIIDPNLQHAAFDRQSSQWPPNPIQNNSMSNQGQGIGSTEYPNTYSHSQNPYDFAGHHNGQYQPFSNSFNPGLSYGGPLIGNYNFSNINPQQYAQVHGQTIAPSALQSYPFNQPDRQIYSQSPAVNLRTNTATYGNSQNNTNNTNNTAQPRRRVYDEALAKSIVDSIPAGTVLGNMAIRTGDAVQKAINSQQLNKFIYISKETFDSDDQRGQVPRIKEGKSLKEMKRKILENQGSQPWDAAQRPLLKKIKLSHRNQTVNPSSAGTGSVASPSSEEESSSDEETDDSDYDEEEKSPLPAAKPKDPVKAMEYDIIEAIWFKKGKQLPAATIRTALGSYWNIIKPTRDAWKVDHVAMQEAEKKNDKVKAETHRKLAAGHRKILDGAFQATIQHGHPDIVEKLSENANLFLSLYQLLVDRFREDDVNGITVRNILNLMVRCPFLNKGLFEKTKLDRILPRLEKKGDSNVQSLVQKVYDIVKSNPEEVNPDSKPSEAEPINKSEPTKPPVSTKASGPAKSKTPTTAGTVKSGNVNMKSANGANKLSTIKNEAKMSEPPKPKPVVKAQSLFSGLQSASKKPGTSLSAQKMNPPEQKVKVEPKKPAPAPTKSFSFADTLANLDKPKDMGPIRKAEEERPKETEEEKKKRLRKESRRHLRVKWRPDQYLEEVRLFTHVAEEDLGHDSNMLLDAADVKNEGQMLKLHKHLALDEDEDGAEEAELAPWHPLSLIDFSTLPDEARADNYSTFGGKREPHSPEKSVQEQRELTTLIAIYTSPADIPFSPREPNDPYSGVPAEEKAFGRDEGQAWDTIRRRENQYYTYHAPKASQQYQSSSKDVYSILSQLNLPSIQQSVAHQPNFAPAPPIPHLIPQPTPQSLQTPPSLEAIFAQHSQPQPQPSVQVPDPNIQLALDFFKHMQGNGAQNVTQALTQPPIQPQPEPVYQPPPAVAPQLDISSILAQLQQQQQQPHGVQPGYNNDNDRKRPYDGGSQSEQYDNKRAKGGNGKKVSLIL
jgi:hypothetical protein